MPEIPTFDLSALDSSVEEERTRLYQQVRIACQNIGFFQLEQHGVSTALMQQTFGMAKILFGLPLEEKEQLNVALSPKKRGKIQ